MDNVCDALLSSFQQILRGNEYLLEVDAIQCCLSYLIIIDGDYCKRNRKSTKCTCILDLVEKQEILFATGVLLYAHGKCSVETRKEFYLKWEGTVVDCYILYRQRSSKKILGIASLKTELNTHLVFLACFLRMVLLSIVYAQMHILCYLTLEILL